MMPGLIIFLAMAMTAAAPSQEDFDCDLGFETLRSSIFAGGQDVAVDIDQQLETILVNDRLRFNFTTPSHNAHPMAVRRIVDGEGPDAIVQQMRTCAYGDKEGADSLQAALLEENRRWIESVSEGTDSQ